MKLLKAAAGENRYYSRPQHLNELQLKISISREVAVNPGFRTRRASQTGCLHTDAPRSRSGG